MKKTTLIIGGNRGIGKSIYEALRKRGDNIYCINRTNIKKNKFLQADITTQNGINLIEKFFNKKKINNLIFSQRYRGENNDEEYNLILKATNDVIKISKFKKDDCSIVILGSIASSTIIGDQNETYHFTRGALETLTKYYAYKLGKQNVRVNCIQPTKIFKPENKKFFNKQNKDRKLIEKITPLGKMGSSEDIANLTEFLTSNKSSYITGTIIPVDGGLRLVGQEQIAKLFQK